MPAKRTMRFFGNDIRDEFVARGEDLRFAGFPGSHQFLVHSEAFSTDLLRQGNRKTVAQQFEEGNPILSGVDYPLPVSSAEGQTVRPQFDRSNPQPHAARRDVHGALDLSIIRVNIIRNRESQRCYRNFRLAPGSEDIDTA